MTSVEPVLAAVAPPGTLPQLVAAIGSGLGIVAAVAGTAAVVAGIAAAVVVAIVVVGPIAGLVVGPTLAHSDPTRNISLGSTFSAQTCHAPYAGAAPGGGAT